MNKFLLYILSLSFIFCSCSEQGIDGLWKIESVSMGEMSMTPNGRWIALAPDKSQVSGNGYLRHSYGSWQYNPTDSTIYIDNTNGIKDEFGPFKVNFQTNNMSWTREEEGNLVTVHLVRANDIPAAPSDSLTGLWSLNKAIQNGKDITLQIDSSNTAYLYFGWDRNYRQTVFENIDGFGVYHPHGHRTSLNLIGNSDRQEYGYEFDNERLILNQSQEGDTMDYVFMRSSVFPE